MKEPREIATLDRPDARMQLRVTLEQSDDGKRAIAIRIWKRDAAGTPQPTKYGISVRRNEVARLIKAIDQAVVEMERPPEPPARLEPRARMDRFLQDVGASPRNNF